MPAFGLLRACKAACLVLVAAAQALDLPPNAALFAPEWSADMEFHMPGRIWAGGRMMMSVQADPEPSMRLRLVRKEARPWITKDSKQTFDQVLNISFATSAFEMRFADGEFCHEQGFAEAGVLLPLFRDTAPPVPGRDACGRTISATSEYGSVSFCVGDDGAPRQMNVSLSAAKVGSTNVPFYMLTAAFVNISLGPLPRDAFAPPAVCAGDAPPAACPYQQGAAEETLTVTRWNHQAGKSCGLNNKMTNDLLGTFTVLSFGASTFFWEYLQVYNVSVHRGFAPMQDCNYDPAKRTSVCTGGHRTAENAKSVGRSSSMYMTGPDGGQCSENTVAGSWYGFPTEGECAAGWDIGFGGCTWKTTSFKVVASRCLVDRCAATTLLEESPYPRSIACLQRAIAECPDQQGPPSATCFSHPAAPEVLV